MGGRFLFIELISLSFAGGCVAAQPREQINLQAVKTCFVPPAERARLLALSYDEFDTDTSDLSWRSLNDRDCTDAALDLLASYSAAHSAGLTPEQKSEAMFHMGQALTFADRNTEASPYFEKALALAAKDEWSTYVAAHLAYTKGDLASLRRARDHYAVIAPGSMRLGFINGLLACPKKRYMEAAYCGH